jgi:hypothetical protein
MEKYPATTIREEIFNKCERKEKKKPVNHKLLEQRELLLKRPAHGVPLRGFKSNTLVLETNKIKYRC